MGYGYLWWTASREGAQRFPGSGWYAAPGAGGQYAVVIPAHHLVVVSREDRDLRLPEPRFSDMAEVLHLVLKAGGLEQAR
jgi:CubicO group peptidase (beta-lactamase class C family)